MRKISLSAGRPSRLPRNVEGRVKVLLGSLARCSRNDLQTTIHQAPAPERADAPLRALAHVSMPVGPIVEIGRLLPESKRQYLSISPGQSDAYNPNPSFERPDQLAAAIKEKTGA